MGCTAYAVEWVSTAYPEPGDGLPLHKAHGEDLLSCQLGNAARHLHTLHGALHKHTKGHPNADMCHASWRLYVHGEGRTVIYTGSS